MSIGRGWLSCDAKNLFKKNNSKQKRGKKMKFKKLLINLIDKKDRRIIRNKVDLQIYIHKQVFIKDIARSLNNKYALFHILFYVKEVLHIEPKNIWFSKANYLTTQKSGHIILTNDLYFNRVYLHQYLICKVLEIDVDVLSNNDFIIHHIDEDKTNNDINNLVILPREKHIAWHRVLQNEDLKNKIKLNDFIEGFIKQQSIIAYSLPLKEQERLCIYIELNDKLNSYKKEMLR